MRLDPRSFNTFMIVTRFFGTSSCEVIEGHVAAGTRRLLEVDAVLPNFGTGDLRAGGPTVYPDLFEWAPCHGHYHVKGYVDLRLWTLSGYAEWRKLRAGKPELCAVKLLSGHSTLAAQMIAGHKEGFCAADVEDTCGTSGHGAIYEDCDFNQGISTGWCDIYPAGTEGQWVDITDLAPGTYVLELEVDPLHLFTESTYANNWASKVIVIP